MVDWNYIRDQILFGLEEFMNWFLSIPMYGQILVIVGIVGFTLWRRPRFAIKHNQRCGHT